MNTERSWTISYCSNEENHNFHSLCQVYDRISSLIIFFECVISCICQLHNKEYNYDDDNDVICRLIVNRPV